PTRVPQGTQAGTQASGQQPAVLFETEDDLTLIPAQLTQAFTVDPTWDRYTDQTAALGGQSAIGFPPFVGAVRLPHVLYLGDEVLLSFTRATTVGLSLDLQGGGPTDDILRFFERLLYQYRSQGLLKTVTPQVAQGTGVPLVTLTIPEQIDLEVVQGVGLAQGVQGRWLRAVLTTPFPDDPVAPSIRLDSIKLVVSASGLRPDLAFSNTAPVDLTKDFVPFGETPREGDTFYLAHEEAFAKEGADVTLHATVRA